MHYVETVYQGKSISEDETWTNSKPICINIACSCFLGKCILYVSMKVLGSNLGLANDLLYDLSTY